MVSVFPHSHSLKASNNSLPYLISRYAYILRPESNILFDARKDLEDWQTGTPEGFSPVVIRENTLGRLHLRPIPQWKDFGIKEISFETKSGAEADTVRATLPHNMQMTPVLTIEDESGGHRIVIETDHAKVGVECLRAEYITKAGRQTYESLGWLSGQRIILTVEHGARVTGLAYRETGYDAAPEGVFSCSEEFYKSINFRACLWPTPSWGWDPAPENDWLKTRDTRRWMDEKGITEHHVSCLEKDWVLL